MMIALKKQVRDLPTVGAARLGAKSLKPVFEAILKQESRNLGL
jgi:hypothetical protein